MNNNIKWSLQPVGDRKVRIIVESLSKLPTIEDYRNYIEKLLGIGQSNNISKLLDGSNSPFIGDNMLLSQELLRMEYKEVVFSTPNGDVIVSAENFEQVFNTLKAERQPKKVENKYGNAEAIGHAINESFEHA